MHTITAQAVGQSRIIIQNQGHLMGPTKGLDSTHSLCNRCIWGGFQANLKRHHSGMAAYHGDIPQWGQDIGRGENIDHA
jgi:hypothetical protein